MDIFASPKHYEMTTEEKENVLRFLSELRQMLSENRYIMFESLIKNLCYEQNPFNKEHPFVDSIIHGIEVARFCMMKKPNISDVLLLSAIGHDWDRACGDLRIKNSDFENTKKGYKEYKIQHSINSARLFCPIVSNFFPDSIIERLKYNIENHEFGGDEDLDVLDFGDSMVFFLPIVSDYYRNYRKYYDEQKNVLPPREMEEERKKGFKSKVNFMIDTLDIEDKRVILKFIFDNLEDYSKNIQEEFKIFLI